VFGLYIHGILQNPFQHRRCGSNHDRTEGEEDAHKNPAGTIVTIAQQNEDFSYRDKTDNGYRAIFYSPQSFHGRVRENLVLSGISQHLECLIERHEKWNGRYVRIRQKGIFEVNLKERGMRIPALDVGFPKHNGKSADTDEHNDYLKKYC